LAGGKRRSRSRFLDDDRCVTMMTEFIEANPELWAEGQ